MARLHFRITTIHLNENEDVSALTAVVCDNTLPLITEMLGKPAAILDTGRGGTEMTITLPITDATTIFSKSGSIPSIDPRSKYTDEMYDSLTRIFYGLMEE